MSGLFLKAIAWIIFSFPLIKLKKCQDTRKHLCTLESGIDVGPWINVGSGKFGKSMKQYVQTDLEMEIKLENIQNLINVWNLIRP
jgi:hypothetical protein